MKKLITNNFSVKLLSVVVAFILWLIIINIDDPYKTKTLIVSVDVINEDAIEAVNKVYEVVEGSTAQVTVKGNRSAVDNLKASDIVATADLSALSDVNAVAIEPRLKKPDNADVELSCNQVLKVKLEDLQTKQMQIIVETQGAPEDGYYVGECSAKPNMIEISGGESTIRKIDVAKVFLNVEGVNSEVRERLIPHLYDVNGDEISSERLSFSVEKVRVTAQVLKVKSVPVEVKITGKPASGFIFSSVDCLPEKVSIAGSGETLDKLDRIEIPISIEGYNLASSGLERDVNTIDYLPEGVSADEVKVVEDNQMISIRINLENAVEKTFSLLVGDIEQQNLSENSELSFYNGFVFQVQVRGGKEMIETLTAKDLGAYIDCSGLSAGKHKVRIQFANNPGIEILNKLYAGVKIKEKPSSDGKDNQENNPSSSPEATATPQPEASGTPEPTKEPQPEETEDVSEE